MTSASRHSIVATLTGGVLIACGSVTDNHVNGVTPMDARGCAYAGIDPVAANISEELNLQVSQDPNRYLPHLVSALAGGTSSLNTKAKRIHDWIAANITYNGDCFGGPNADPKNCFPVDSATTLEAGRAVCEGYAVLFTDMATKAGLSAVTITGNARFTSGTNYTAADSGHAWNGVQLDDGTWGLVDTTWDAGYFQVFGTGFNRIYSTQWYLPDAYTFLSTHWPALSSQQFMQYSKIAPSTQPVSYSTWYASSVVEPSGTQTGCAEK